MLSELALVVVQVPLSVPRMPRLTERVYDAGSVTVTVPLELGSVSDSVVSTAEGAAPAADEAPVPLNASVVVVPSPDTVAVPLIEALVIATGDVVVPCGWSMFTATVLPTVPESGVMSVSSDVSVSAATPLRLHVYDDEVVPANAEVTPIAAMPPPARRATQAPSAARRLRLRWAICMFPFLWVAPPLGKREASGQPVTELKHVLVWM
jgi:hypothetical protein